MDCDGRMELDRSTTASRNSRKLAADRGELRAKKREENLPFLPPLFFFPLNPFIISPPIIPFIISPPIIPQKKRKEKIKKERAGAPRAPLERKNYDKRGGDECH
uniref:Uncharacterized protein n=1 Tax=Siphoviridae sp. ctVCm11 TaxID=2826358 RepID=A0A8S5QKT6_9CAUD|nr:MAG TPA: hypothetical protein [Siphoviridae sp. ctVCm11]